MSLSLLPEHDDGMLYGAFMLYELRETLDLFLLMWSGLKLFTHVNITLCILSRRTLPSKTSLGRWQDSHNKHWCKCLTLPPHRYKLDFEVLLFPKEVSFGSAVVFNKCSRVYDVMLEPRLAVWLVFFWVLLAIDRFGLWLILIR